MYNTIHNAIIGRKIDIFVASYSRRLSTIALDAEANMQYEMA